MMTSTVEAVREIHENVSIAPRNHWKNGGELLTYTPSRQDHNQRKQSLRKVLIAGISLLISSVTVAQTAKLTHPGPTPPRGYERTPFDVNSERLPPNFQGHDVEALYAALQKIRPKGEYETSAAYKERLEAVRSTSLYGSVLGSSAIAVIMPKTDILVGDEEGFSWTYDADKAVLRLRVKNFERGGAFTSSGTGFSDRSLNWCDDCPPVLTVSSHVVDSGYYEGQTALGVWSGIRKHYVVGYGLTIDPWDVNTDYDLPLPVSEAKLIRPNLRLVVVGHLEPPWTSPTQEVWHEPTLDDPVNKDVKVHVIMFQPEQLWIVDIKSGEILMKIAGPG